MTLLNPRHFLLLLSILLTSCSSKKAPEWPTLLQLDELAIACEAYAELKDEANLDRLFAKTKPLVESLESTQPENPKDPALVTLYRQELESWGLSVQKKNLTSAEKEALAYALHPIIERLILATGLPHEHPETSKPHEH